MYTSEHTKFSLSRFATRTRWKIKNSRQSRCLGGSMLTVFRRCVQRSALSSMAIVVLASNFYQNMKLNLQIDSNTRS